MYDDDDCDLAEKTESNAFKENVGPSLNTRSILQEAFLMGKSASLMYYSRTADTNILDPYEVQQISSAINIYYKATL